MKTLLYITFIISIIIQGCRKSDYAIPEGPIVLNDNGAGVGTTTWEAGKNYLIDGKVYVNEGQTLTIQAGAVIRFKSGQGEDASALIVARGGKILAKGTVEYPIVFTAQADDLNGSVPTLNTGLWGGIYILGRAPINTESGEANIEGIPETEPRAIYGGLTPNDDSGVFKYVSIRHAGTKISDVNDINGLTLGGVGNGTTIEYVEVISCKDDGFEVFGGTVNCKYLVSAFNSDDAFDFENGYAGNFQFLVAIQNADNGDKLVEIDDRENHPRMKPLISNGTFIGQGSSFNKEVAIFGASSAGIFYNSIFLNQKNGVSIEYQNTKLDSYSQFTAGKLALNNNIFFNVAGNSGESVFSAYTNTGIDITEIDKEVKAHFTKGKNIIYDPGISSVAPYNLIPKNAVSGNLATLPDGFDEVLFKGAVGSNNWVRKWTLLDKEGFLQ